MADTEAVENLKNAIKLTQKLRASVTEVFSDLSSGFSNTQGNEKPILSDLQKSLLGLNNNFNELEKVAAGLSPLPLAFTSSFLTLDPVLHKTSLNSQLLLTHKWTNKMHEVASYASNLLTQNQLKRSQHMGISQASKRMGRIAATAHSIAPSYVDNSVAKLDNLHPDISVMLNRPFGSCAVIEITIGKTMRVLVVLRGLIIEWVSVKGFQEDFHSEDGKIDIWSKSKYHVFQKVSEHCSAAMLHFFSPYSLLFADIALNSFFVWLASYRTLFSSSCHKCSKHLVNNLPPTWRDVRHKTPYHDWCRP